MRNMSSNSDGGETASLGMSAFMQHTRHAATPMVVGLAGSWGRGRSQLAGGLRGHERHEAHACMHDDDDYDDDDEKQRYEHDMNHVNTYIFH